MAPYLLDPLVEQFIAKLTENSKPSERLGRNGADPYGSQSCYSCDVGAADGYEASLTGRYKVSLYRTYHSTRCEDVSVEIYDGDLLLDTLSVNHLQSGGQWNVLGTYEFTGRAEVVIIAESKHCSTAVHAARYRKKVFTRYLS